ncbi:FAD dependent oxidoreductase-domain-containing protein [Cantharellus anzutake]|uniref:FAD dependent oxidoreductase-domain-containing protein n=1 Tax=Cantharellus anzutake TaxID=1750568 RepID=UPI0019042539|nr:FAD dependent oxidoreductase-domain-containing protein [Cantharellus anzutake]KAF8342678.1 FAD dependent oxidoreductase-domain-containing protein [Cantharellus anzutake]
MSGLFGLASSSDDHTLEAFGDFVPRGGHTSGQCGHSPSITNEANDTPSPFASYSKEVNLLIIGAGVFGLSAALHLLRRGYKHVTVLDRSDVFPAPDAASTDINKIVRSSYSDAFYTRLAKEAIELWKGDNDTWNGCYFESGVAVLGNLSPSSDGYAAKAYRNDIELGQHVITIENHSDFAPFFDGVKLGEAFKCGYVNLEGGWAFASKGLECARKTVEQLGGRVVGGKKVVQLVFDDDDPGTNEVVGGEGKCKGVKLEGGMVLDADVTIVATGAWTGSLFGEEGTGLGEGKVVATAHWVVMVQLSEEEAVSYRKIPVVLDFNTGFYLFPPNHDNIVKMAFHNSGFVDSQPLASAPSNTPSSPTVPTPRTTPLCPGTHLAIPHHLSDQHRQCLTAILPELGAKPFKGTRLCWYTDTPDANWIIDWHPKRKGLMFATGGSGHGYKVGVASEWRLALPLCPRTRYHSTYRPLFGGCLQFLPVLGRLVADRFEERWTTISSNAFHSGGGRGEDPSRRVRFLPYSRKIQDLTCSREAHTLLQAIMGS